MIGKPRIVVGLTPVGELEPPWTTLFQSTAARFAARLVDRGLALRFRRFAERLALARYSAGKPAPVSAIFYPNEEEVVFLDGALDGDAGRFSCTETYFAWVVQHELAHVVDHVSGYALSSEFATAVGSTFHGEGADRRYVPGNVEHLQYPTTISGVKSVFEDFAESVAVYLTAGAYMRGECGRVDKARLAACGRLFQPEDHGDERSSDDAGPVPDHQATAGPP
jgi:hypothetical protein